MLYKILKTVIATATILAALIYFVYSMFVSALTVYEYMILSLLILIATTYLLENLDENNKWRKVEKNLKDAIQSVSDCQIAVFNNSFDWVNAMEDLIAEGSHSIDTASLDSTTRSKPPNQYSRVWTHITDCCKRPRIKFRHIIRIRRNNFENLLDRILAGSSKENSFFAYYELPPSFSFPTFGVIDDRYVCTRSPYHEGETARYLIIDNKEIALYYIRYFEELWDKSTIISSYNTITAIYKQLKGGFSQDELRTIDMKMKKIKKEGIIDDI